MDGSVAGKSVLGWLELWVKIEIELAIDKINPPLCLTNTIT